MGMQRPEKEVEESEKGRGTMSKCNHQWIDREDFLKQVNRIHLTKTRTIKLRLKCWRCGYTKNIKTDLFDSEDFLYDLKFK